MKKVIRSTLAAVGLAVALTASASAQTVKVGVINTFSGPQASYGELSDKAMRLYLKQHAAELPPGVTIELINRDDTGPNPDKAKQLAQELVVRDKVNILMGATFTPNALAMAAIADQAGIPVIITNAGTSIITEKSENLARTSFTMWQSAIPLGTWAAKNFKTAYTLVSDYAPGFDMESGFTKGFTAGGGTIVGNLRVPVTNQDFSAYMQRVKDAHPDALMVFVPGGKSASAVMKAFADLGLKQAGIKLIGPGDIVPDEELPNMGDEALGVMTVHQYSASADRPANKAFIAAWKQAYGADSTPNHVAVSAYDGIAAVFAAVKAQGGKMDTAKTMALLKEYKNPDSPRGPISIDPATRDIVQNEYLRETKRVDGKLENVELETVATAEKDPWKEQQKK